MVKPSGKPKRCAKVIPCTPAHQQRPWMGTEASAGWSRPSQVTLSWQQSHPGRLPCAKHFWSLPENTDASDGVQLLGGLPAPRGTQASYRTLWGTRRAPQQPGTGHDSDLSHFSEAVGLLTAVLWNRVEPGSELRAWRPGCPLLPVASKGPSHLQAWMESC